MADRFLGEVRDMHQLRKDIRSLPSTNAEEFMKRLGDRTIECFGHATRSCRLAISAAAVAPANRIRSPKLP